MMLKMIVHIHASMKAITETIGTTLYIHVHVKLRVMHELQYMCSIIMYMYSHFARSGVSAMRYTGWFLRLLSTKHLSAAMSAGHPALLCSSALATTVVQVCVEEREKERKREGKRSFIKNTKTCMYMYST